MEQTRDVYVVIPVRNRRGFTQACLESLRDQTLSHVVVVVDDGSDDGTPEMVRSQFPQITLLSGDGTLWWTGGVNRAVAWVLAHCRADDLVVTLNDDTVLPPDYLARLTAPVAREYRLLLGSVSVSENDGDTIVDGGVRIDWWRAKYLPQYRGQSARSAFAQGGLFDVDVLSGCGTLIPVRAFRELGPYDQRRLPHYGADYEFSRRAKRAGYKVAINGNALLRVRDRSTGLHADVGRGGLVDLLRSFFSRRSATNLPMRVQFARLAAPRRLLIPFLFCDLARVILGSIRRAVARRPLDEPASTP